MELMASVSVISIDNTWPSLATRIHTCGSTHTLHLIIRLHLHKATSQSQVKSEAVKCRQQRKRRTRSCSEWNKTDKNKKKAFTLRVRMNEEQVHVLQTEANIIHKWRQAENKAADVLRRSCYRNTSENRSVTQSLPMHLS